MSISRQFFIMLATSLMLLGLACSTTPFANNPPRVLLIGDSISIGYTPFVCEALTNRAVVIHAPGNNASTRLGLNKIEEWLGEDEWDIIHFNWGLHDLKHNKKQAPDSKVKPTQSVLLPQYEENLRVLVERLKKSNATLIWCATTPVPENSYMRTAGDEVLYNAAALRIMRAEGIMVNDLHAFAAPETRRLQMGGKPRNVHYTPEGYKALAGEVVKAIEKALRQGKRGHSH